MAKYLLLRGWLVFLKTSVHCGLPIFLKVNHQLESRMQENCQSGSEGGAKLSFVPTPISALGFNPGEPAPQATRPERPLFPDLSPHHSHRGSQSSQRTIPAWSPDRR